MHDDPAVGFTGGDSGERPRRRTSRNSAAEITMDRMNRLYGLAVDVVLVGTFVYATAVSILLGR
jgi:hypothetical protein